MLKAYRYRIYPNEAQKNLMEQTFGCTRFIYNFCLDAKKYAYEQNKVNLSAYNLMAQLPYLKQQYEWLKLVDSQSLFQAILNVDFAYKMFFNGSGFPKFKKKCNEQSFSAPNNRRKVDFEKGTLSIPKLPDIKMKVSRRFEGKIKTVTITKIPSGKYFASILVDNGVKNPKKRKVTPEGTIGIDLGLKEFAVLSDGRRFENHKFLANSTKRLEVLQRRLSRKVKGSKNRNKARIRVAVLHERIANQRKDCLHKLSTQIVNESQVDTICVETLAVKNMVKNENLAQAIGDVGWSEFVRQLEYKCEWYGKNLIKIGRFEPSTKTCNNCLAVNNTLTLKDREWICGGCNTVHDRDLNAARNIRDIGLRNTRQGMSGEPVELSAVVGAKKTRSRNIRTTSSSIIAKGEISI